MLSDLVDEPAFWGMLGAFIYAASVLIASLWGDEPAVGTKRARALAQFMLSVIVGPVMAAGFGPSLFSLGFLKSLDHRAISLSVGLSANYIWPIAVKALGQRVKLFGGAEK